MMRSIVLIILVGVAVGCGGPKELPPTTDAETIRREQERLRGQAGGPADKPKKTR